MTELRAASTRSVCSSSPGIRTTLRRDADGVAPFTTPGDFSTFNPPYFTKAADVVKRAAQRGMVVFIAPCWAGYDAGQGFYDMMVANGPTKSRNYGTAVANVFKDFDNVVWVMGGDKPGSFSTAEIDAMVAGVRSVDTRHLVTAHWNFQPTDAHPGAWQDIASCYDWNGGVSYTQVEQEYSENDAPVILLEALYELNTQYGATTDILRLQSIMALLSGAKGSFFGHEGVWHLGASKNLPSQSQGSPLRPQQHRDAPSAEHPLRVRDARLARPRSRYWQRAGHRGSWIARNDRLCRRGQDRQRSTGHCRMFLPRERSR